MANKQTLDDFISEVIDGWMVEDVKKLLAVPFKPNSPGNCNFPIALYVFSCVEFLGQLTPVQPIGSQPGYTKRSVLGFIDDFFPDSFKDGLKPYRQQFVNIFRNGLAHNYFAKNAGVSRSESEPFQVSGQGNLVLDADKFAKSFLEAVNELKQRVKSDPKLADRMVERYNSQYQGNLQYNFSSSVRQTTTTTTTTSTARASGASLAHPDMVKNLKYTTTLPYNPDED